MLVRQASRNEYQNRSGEEDRRREENWSLTLGDLFLGGFYAGLLPPVCSIAIS